MYKAYSQYAKFMNLSMVDSKFLAVMGSENGKIIRQCVDEKASDEHDIQVRYILYFQWAINILGAIVDSILGMFNSNYQSGMAERLKPSMLIDLENKGNKKETDVQGNYDLSEFSENLWDD